MTPLFVCVSYLMQLLSNVAVEIVCDRAKLNSLLQIDRRALLE